MIGININCSEKDYIELILNKKKGYETRDSNSLDSYIGRKVGLVKTGCGKAMMCGFAVIGEPIIIKEERDFYARYDMHLVERNSKYKFSGVKYLYPMVNPERCEQYIVKSRGIVARNIDT